jgi:hypothetical protein
MRRRIVASLRVLAPIVIVAAIALVAEAGYRWHG